MVDINGIIDLGINLSDDITIMGHKYIDLDALGGALGLLKYCIDNNKKVHVYLNPNEFNTSILKTLEILPKEIKDHFVYDESCINPNDKSLLVVLDVSSSTVIENKDLFDKFSNSIVIDHHQESKSKLDSTVSYINSDASSIVEVICDFLKSKNYKINDPEISTAMYTGMCIDTNNFDSATRANTMMCAAYLLENGASIKRKRILFQEKKEDIFNRSRLIKRSTSIDVNTVICVLDSNIYTVDELAKISNELLKFDQIDTAYTIGKTKTHTVRISARCFEGEDVEAVMSLLGGGGHKTAAAVDIKGVSLSKAKEMLLAILNPNKEIDMSKELKKEINA